MYWVVRGESRLRDVVGAFLAAILGVGIVMFSWPSGAWGLGLGAGLASAFGTIGVALLWNWLAERANERAAARRYIELQTPFSLVVHEVSKLSVEQAALIPRVQHDIQLNVIGAGHVVGFMLATPHGNVPYAWIGQYLERCGVTFVYPVSRFGDGSSGRLCATAFTYWLLEHRWVVQFNGNRTYAWIDEGARERVKRALMLEEVLGLEAWANERDPGDGEQGAAEAVDGDAESESHSEAV